MVTHLGLGRHKDDEQIGKPAQTAALTMVLLASESRLDSLRSKPPAGEAHVFLPWGSDDPHDLEREVPRLRLETAAPFLTMPELVERLSRSKAQRRLTEAMGRFGWYRRSLQHYRYVF